MNDDDNIPLLEDIIVEGDPDKTLNTKVDPQHIESIESFDRLFEDDDGRLHDSEDNPYIDPQNEPEAVSETEEEKSDFASTSYDSDISLRAEEAPETTDNSEEDYTDSSLTDLLSQPEESREPQQTSEELFGDLPSVIDEKSHNQIPFNTRTTEGKTDTGEEPDNENFDTQSSKPFSTTDRSEIELEDLTEKIMQDVMPHITEQVETIIRKSLEKHLHDASSAENQSKSGKIEPEL